MNLLQFKVKLAEILAADGTINLTRTTRDEFPATDPRFLMYPNGVFERIETFEGCKLGRVASTQFTRLTEKGESWCSFGKASEWAFAENSATWLESGEYGGIKSKISLTYTW